MLDLRHRVKNTSAVYLSLIGDSVVEAWGSRAITKSVFGITFQYVFIILSVCHSPERACTSF